MTDRGSVLEDSAKIGAVGHVWNGISIDNRHIVAQHRDIRPDDLGYGPRNPEVEGIFFNVIARDRDIAAQDPRR